jgi:hypothetical protein
MTKKLKRAFEDQKKQAKPRQLSGSLGIPINGQRRVEVPNRNSFVYVRLRDSQSEVIQAFNNKVSASYGLPVIIEYYNNRYTVVSVDTARYQNNWTSFAPYLARHGNTHSFDTSNGGGGDITWVQSRQFMPLLVIPSGTNGGPNVIVSSHTLQKQDGTWINIADQGTASFLPYLPTGSNAVMGLVFVDADSGNTGFLINSGSYFANSVTGTSQIVPYLPALPNPNQIPLAGVRLVTGTSSIIWNNIYDVRPFFHARATGSVGGGPLGISGIAAQDEGVPLGTGTVFNFVGGGVTASISGAVVNVNVPSTSALPFAIVSSNYSTVTVTGSSTRSIILDTELVDSDNLVSLSGNIVTINGPDGWYDINAVVDIDVNGGSPVSGGDFEIHINNTGLTDAVYTRYSMTAGKVVHLADYTASTPVEISAGNNTIDLELKSFTVDSIEAYVAFLKIKKL